MYISYKTLLELEDSEFKRFISLIFQIASINHKLCTFPPIDHAHTSLCWNQNTTSLKCTPAFDLMYYELCAIREEDFFLNIYFTTPGSISGDRLKGESPFDYNRPSRHHFLMLYSLYIPEVSNEVLQENYLTLFKILIDNSKLQLVSNNLERIKLTSC